VKLVAGTTAWETPLPAEGEPSVWIVKACRNVVIVYSQEAPAPAPLADTALRLGTSLEWRPAACRLPGLADTLYHAWADRTVPVLFLDPATGRVRKRIDVPTRGPFATVWFEGDDALVATGDRIVWLK
jgi:hypothetical protein